ncbi:uncharacterized protein LOC122060041 isoform X1 [Macadamia integrifolia]|uniref:uncharacterized protein LOC122060041 isoform X1 n=1 Tax=Macadamia integrifolia TaxID=60698 RepID=UPI001C4F095D|nr:uncharacterized protein LOC122060041 isoform X1 [Macadamia integrifolia]
MSAVAENSMADEEIGFRRPRNQPIIASDRDPKIPSIIQSIRCKSTISFFLSTFTNNSNNNNNDSDESSRLQLRKKNFTSITFRTFRGLGCATSSQVSAPKVIRSSADWQAKKVRKKKQRNPHTKKNLQGLTASPTSFAVVPDVWCSPGISFVADTDPIDCVIARRPVAGRGRVDGERMNHRERSYNTRPSILEHISVLDSPSAFEILQSGADIYGDRHYRHFRHHSPGGLAEIVMFQGSLLLGGGSDQLDQYRDWRLDIDNMSYEELLELGDRIGYVSNGLKEDEILRCLRKSKNMIMDDLPSTLLSEPEWKCSVCQEEYEADDAEVGKLDCGHSFHICCIKKWLVRKNACPVCKAIAAVQQ